MLRLKCECLLWLCGPSLFLARNVSSCFGRNSEQNENPQTVTDGRVILDVYSSRGNNKSIEKRNKWSCSVSIVPKNSC